jgi:hypothetical protein
MEDSAAWRYTGFMRRACSPQWTVRLRRRGISTLVLVLLAAVASPGLGRLGPVAGDSSAQDLETTPLAAGVPAGDSRRSLSADPRGVSWDRAIAASHTLFLPRISRDYWEAPDSCLGVQVGHGSLPREAMDKAAYMGAKWVRLPLHWDWIEPSNTTPEAYRWAYDETLAYLAAKKVRVILTLVGNPSWAATYAQGPVDLVDLGEVVEFMVAVVGRYGRPPYNVKYWEFYNEPDNGGENYAEAGGWGYFGNEPEAYAQLLEAVYRPMKAADPEAQIVFGGMAYDAWTSTGGPFVEEFLDRVLDYDGGKSFDVLNFHYYPAFRGHWDPYGPGIMGKATYLRDKLAARGVEKPLICTEASMWSDEDHGGSDELQSRYVAQLYARSMAADLGTTIWFWLIDSAAPGFTEYGLLTPDLSLKPAYGAYRTLARQLASARYVQALTATQTGSEQIEAYEFARQEDATHVVVAWATDEEAHEMWLQVGQVLVVDKYGNATSVRDGDDGEADGRVRVTVGPSPVYLHFSG